MTSPRTLSRITGLLYLLTSLLFVFAVEVRANIIDSGNAATTSSNIRASATLFRAAFVADLVSSAGFLLMVLALYLLLRHVNHFAALAMVTLIAVMTAVAYLNALNQFSALAIATSPEYTRTFGQAGANALVMTFADIQDNGLGALELFWGLWLLPLGYLVIKSGWFPKAIGILLLIAGASWIGHFLVLFLAPDLGVIRSVLSFGTMGEIVFILWLLIMGARVPRPDAANLASPQRPVATNVTA